MKLNKIYILGTSGSGKTYLAKKLSEKLNVKYFDLDDIYWIKKFSEKLPKDKRAPKLKILLKENKNWIIEGVYTDWSIEAIKNSDLIILMDTPFRARVYRIFKRFLKRRKTELKESWKDCFNLIKYSGKYKKSEDSTSYHHHKLTIKEYNKNYIILKNKKQINKFLNSLK